MSKKSVYFNYDFSISLTKKQAQTGSHSGDCEGDVKYLLTLPSIKKQFESIDPESIRKELKEYGAWDEEELKDDESNRMRILWIACGDYMDGRF